MCQDIFVSEKTSSKWAIFSFLIGWCKWHGTNCITVFASLHYYLLVVPIIGYAKGIDKSQDNQHVSTGSITGCSLPTSPLPYSSQATQHEVTGSTTSSWSDGSPSQDNHYKGTKHTTRVPGWSNWEKKRYKSSFPSWGGWSIFLYMCHPHHFVRILLKFTWWTPSMITKNITVKETSYHPWFLFLW